MNKVIILFTILFIHLGVAWSQETSNGIVFQKISYQEALTLSKSTSKPIFIDAYTVWCGPCKYMDKKIFSDPEVGKYFNEHFINIKIEMEQHEDAPELARRFRVVSYPTLLFIGSDERLLNKQIGVVDGVILIDQAKSVIKSLR